MRLDDLVHVLKALPLFRRVEAEALRVLVFSGSQRSLRAGEILFRRGEMSDGAFLVLEGEIILDCRDDGSPSPHVFRAGALIGQSALFLGVQRGATALARSHASVLVLPQALMLKVLDAYPQSAAAMREALAEDARQLSQSLERLPL
jgi:CRP-like cAMP-binding protein